MKRFIAAITIACAAIHAHAQTFYHLESSVTLKSAVPEWDYVTLDASRGYLFIGRRGEGAVVYDVNKKVVVRTIDNTDHANAIALVPEFDRGYTTNSDGTTTVFVLSTLKPIERVKFGKDADSGFYEPVTKQLAFTMGDAKAIAFVDARSGKLLDTMKIDSEKPDGAVADGEGNLLMALRDHNTVVKIDVAARKVSAEWSTAGCEDPTSIAYDRTNKRIFVGCRGRKPVLAVLDAISGKVITTMAIGQGNDGVIYDAATKKIYTSNGFDANLVIYDQLTPDSYQFAGATTTRPVARTMAFDETTKRIYLVTAEGMVDPKKPIYKVAPFYPNRYFPDTFTVLTYAPQ
ncbi:MAG TPA: YncE family protein [Usitatibacteraceae bacterium]